MDTITAVVITLSVISYIWIKHFIDKRIEKERNEAIDKLFDQIEALISKDEL